MLWIIVILLLVMVLAIPEARALLFYGAATVVWLACCALVIGAGALTCYAVAQ
jgi:hypothetical protein